MFAGLSSQSLRDLIKGVGPKKPLVDYVVVDVRDADFVVWLLLLYLIGRCLMDPMDGA
jgi:hypothetical protein